MVAELASAIVALRGPPFSPSNSRYSHLPFPLILVRIDGANVVFVTTDVRFAQTSHTTPTTTVADCCVTRRKALLIRCDRTTVIRSTQQFCAPRMKRAAMLLRQAVTVS